MRQLKTISDKDGNSLLIEKGEVMVDLHLKLKGQARSRAVGTINKETKTLHLKRNRAKHLHRKSNSYGLNHYILSNGKLFDTVQLSDEYGDYSISKKELLDKGTFLYFKQKGFELQIFVPLNVLEQYKIEPSF